MLRVAALILSIAIFPLQLALGQTSHPEKRNVFFEDTPISQPAPIPENVVTLLLQTDEGEEGAEFLSALVAHGDCDPEACNPRHLLRAAEVQLDRSNQRDLVVIGVCPMCGAGVGWFWIVRSADSDPKVVLFAPGSSLELLKTRTRGMRDVRSSWWGASQKRETIYHFDDSDYKQWKEKRSESRS